MKKTLPFFILFALLTLLGWELFYAKPDERPSALLGKELPVFSLPNLYLSEPRLNSSALNNGFILLNVWATWCYACRQEHEMLMKIKNVYHIPIYGITYKDKADDAIQWLKQNGNPYVMVGVDFSGDAAIDLGVYGTPETFVLRNGRIIYRHIGRLDQKDWDEKLSPLIKEKGA